ncbi:MAG: O-antigen ligase family protein [Coriobacteriia bacterium]|nr:O-antigen ligase family protein [Coriobacteriia bacterium]
MAKRKKSKSKQHKPTTLRNAAAQTESSPAQQKTRSSEPAAVAAAGAHGAEFAPEIGDFSMREMSAEGRFTFYVLLTLVFLVPLAMNFFFANQGMVTYDAFDTVKVWVLRVGSLVLLVSWLIDLLKNGGEIRYHKIYLLLAGLLIWIGISTVVSVSPLTAFFGKHKRYDGLWSYLIYAILFFVTVQYVTTYERIKLLARTLSLSSLFVAFYGLLQWLPAVLNPAFTFIGKHIFGLKSAVSLNLDLLPWGQLPFEKFRSFSTYGNPDLLAGFLAFGFFVTLGLVLSEERKSWRVFYWIVLVLNGMVMITAKSRSIWVGGAVGLILAVILLIKQKPRWMKLDFGFAGGVGLGAVLVAVTSLGSKSVVMNFWSRVTSIFQFKSGSALTRFEIWGAALRAIKERPLFGWGSDTFRLVFRRFEPFVYNKDASFDNVADNVHNFPLQLAVGIGVIGMLAFYSFMVWVIAPAIKLCVAPDDKHKGERMIFIGFVAAVVAYNVHLFFGISIPGASFLLWILLGVLIVPRTRAVVIDPVPWVVPASVAAVVLALVPTVFATRFIMADHHYYLAGAYSTQDDKGNLDENALDASIAEAKSACRLNPTIEIYRAREVSLLTQKTQAAVQKSPQNAAAQIKQTEQSITTLLKLSPYEYDSYLYAAIFWNMMGGQYQSLGNTKQANAYYDKTVKTLSPQVDAMPNGLALRYYYGLALQGQGKMDEALKQFQFCVKGDPRFQQAKQAYDELKASQSQAATATPGPFAPAK